MESFLQDIAKQHHANAVNFALENGYDAVTCGHTHFAEDIVLNGIRYINTGAWTEFPAFFLLITDNEMSLEKTDDSIMVPRLESDSSREAGISMRLNKAPLNPRDTRRDIGEILSSSAAAKLDPH